MADKDRHERAESRQSRMHPSGKYDFEDAPDCGGEGWFEMPDGQTVPCYGKGCH